MTTLRLLRGLIVDTYRDGPTMLAKYLTRAVMRYHDGTDDGDGNIYCTVHWGKPQAWPCSDYFRAAERMADLEADA